VRFCAALGCCRWVRSTACLQVVLPGTLLSAASRSTEGRRRVTGYI